MTALQPRQRASFVGPVPPRRATAADYVSLTKPRIIELLLVTTFPVADAATLANNLAAIYERAANAEVGQYDIAAVTKIAPQIMYRLFDVRMRLRDRLGEFEKKGVMGPGVQQALRDCFRILRYVSDMTGEIARHHGGHDTDEAGLTGMADPFCRRAYPWGREDAELVEQFRGIARERRASRALRTGGMRLIPEGPDVLTIERFIEGGVDAFGQSARDETAVVRIDRRGL